MSLTGRMTTSRVQSTLGNLPIAAAGGTVPRMVSPEDAAAMAEEFPEVTLGERWGNRTWLVGGKGFAWERPLSKADIKRFGGETPPDGPIFAVRTADMS